MNKQTTLKIKAGLISGVVYALMTAGFYFVDGQGFGLWRFAFSFFLER